MIFKSTDKKAYTLGSFSSEKAESLRFMRTKFLSEVKKAGGDVRLVLCAAESKADDLARAVLNLGCALAAVGKRVLVIDVDRKNARVRELTGKAGKTYNDYLAGRVTAAEMGEKTAVEGLSVIACDADCKVNMQDDAKTFELFGKLRDRYDYILVVAAPVKEGTDAFSCDEACDAVILFVKKDATKIGFIKKMTEHYAGRDSLVLGAVLI